MTKTQTARIQTARLRAKLDTCKTPAARQSVRNQIDALEYAIILGRI